jgi:hypothetical protein
LTGGRFADRTQWNLAIGQRVSTGMATALKIGTVLPAFELVAQDRSIRALPDLSGPNLLVFYRGDW